MIYKSLIKVGTAARVVTPPLGTAMAGYFEEHRAKEVCEDLLTTALVMEDALGRQIAIVSVDVLVLDADFICRVRQEIESSLNIPARNIMVCATHTHTGPVTAPIFTSEPEPAYLQWLQKQMVDAVLDAGVYKSFCKICLAHTFVEGISSNRRLLFKDGKVHTHITPDYVQNIVGIEGPTDTELVVLSCLDGKSNSPTAALVNFPLHPTNVRGDRIHPDYPGPLRKALQKQFGNEMTTVFLNGPCGNIDSKTPALEQVPYGPGRAVFIGETLAKHAVRALTSEQSEIVESFTLDAVSRTIQVPIRRPSPEQLTLARKVLSGEVPLEKLSITGDSKRPSTTKEQVYAQEWVALAELQESAALCEVNAFRIGNLAIVGVPVELFCEYGLQIKRKGNELFRRTAVAELANGYLGYMPTVLSFERGGYETRLARSSFLAPEAGPQIVQTASELLEELAGHRKISSNPRG